MKRTSSASLSKRITRVLPFLLLLCVSLLRGQVCNSSGNLIIYTNYDGGPLTINVNQNISNLKIGICSYEACDIFITETFSSNVTEVRYAGYNGANNNSCSGSIPTTTITGAGTASTSIVFAPASTISNPNGYGSIICGYSCNNSTSQGGCNTVDQIEAYFLNYFSGSNLYAHRVQYGCWTGTQSVSAGGNCCPVLPLLPGTVAGSQTICAADLPAALTSGTAASGGQGTITYTWQASTTTSTSGFSNIPGANAATYAPGVLTVSTWYRRAASTTSNNPAYSNVLEVLVNPMPSVILPATATLCAGDTLPLQSMNGISFYWEGPAGYFSTQQHPVISGGSGFYKVTATAAGGCTASAGSNISVHLPPWVVAAANISDLCRGDSVVLTASGAASYTWQQMQGQPSYYGSVVVLTPSASTQFTVTGNDQNGCSGMSFVIVSVHDSYDITLSASSTVICSGNQATITATGPSSILWSPGGSTAPTIIVSPVASTIYTVQSQNYYECFRTRTLTIDVKPSPDLIIQATNTLICAQQHVTLSVSGAANYQWLGQSAATSHSLAVSPQITTTYSVTGTAQNNCSSTASITVEVDACDAITENVLEAGVSVFPNPSEGQIFLSAQFSVQVQLFSVDGRLLEVTELNSANNYKTNISKLIPGTYFLKLFGGGTVLIKRLLVAD